MKLSLFDYHLDPSKIAQHPSEKRDHSKLLRVDKLAKQDPIDHMFYDLPNLLSKGDVLVINNTKVRIFLLMELHHLINRIRRSKKIRFRLRDNKINNWIKS